MSLCSRLSKHVWMSCELHVHVGVCVWRGRVYVWLHNTYKECHCVYVHALYMCWLQCAFILSNTFPACPCCNSVQLQPSPPCSDIRSSQVTRFGAFATPSNTLCSLVWLFTQTVYPLSTHRHSQTLSISSNMTDQYPHNTNPPPSSLPPLSQMLLW